MSYPEIISIGVLKQIVADTSFDLMPKLLSAFCMELDNHRELLIIAVDNNDLYQISEEAHAIKSCSGTFGAQKLYQQSMLLEEAANAAPTSLNGLKETAQILLTTIANTKHAYTTFDFDQLRG